MPPAIPQVDRRALDLRHLDRSFELPRFRTRSEWEERARELRTHILAVNGLIPMPPRAPLRARVFGTVRHADYSVSKVHFQSYPGFLVTGNLFVPAGRPGPFPAVLNPHGHWEQGRLVNTELGTVLGRGITFARQGYVAFCYDMIGYNDSTQVVHREESDSQRLWGFGQMALQLYDSIRAVDFLQSLPTVDPDRIGCTGASGGGTQTFMLMAADDRIKAAAPVNMISAHMQGGCVCENAPSLRVEATNPEIAGLMAPRPLLMVAATGDWTKDTPRVEYPFVRSIYSLYHAEDRVECALFDAEHNYNRDSRNAVYRFFGKWLLGAEHPEELVERPYRLDGRRKYLVFSDRPRPRYAPTGEKLFAKLIRSRGRQLSDLLPKTRADLRGLQQDLAPAMRHLLMAEVPRAREVRAARGKPRRVLGASVTDLMLTRPAVGDRVPALLLRPPRAGRSAALVVSGEGKASLFNPVEGPVHPFVKRLLKGGRTVLLLDCWGTGEARVPEERDRRAAEIAHFLTYNRSDDANRVQDMLTGLGYLRSLGSVRRVDLAGLGRAGVWALLARTQAPFVGRVLAEVAGFHLADDRSFLDGLMIPGLRSIGDLLTAVALIAPAPLCLHDPEGRLAEAAGRIYAATASGHLCLHSRPFA